LAFDPNTNTLYGSDLGTNQLITINTATGAGTAAGALGFNGVVGLAFDPDATVIPEPSTWLAMGAGLAVLLRLRQRARG
jgi:hypothetical protein